jgi:hypothetical protein
LNIFSIVYPLSFFFQSINSILLFNLVAFLPKEATALYILATTSIDNTIANITATDAINSTTGLSKSGDAKKSKIVLIIVVLSFPF